MLNKALWIKTPYDIGTVCPEFYKKVDLVKKVKRAILSVSAVGMYIAYINGNRIGNEIFTPYWTEYKERIQYQTYDITDMICENNELSFICAEGWAVGRIGYDNLNHSFADHISLIYSLEITYDDNKTEIIVSNETTKVRTSQIMYSQIYDGEYIDKTAVKKELGFAVCDEVKTKLIEQIGERVTEQDRISPVRHIVTPKGEHVVDFGQNLSGYVEVQVHGNPGDVVKISHAEVLDSSGNFYTDNLRKAKQEMKYTLSGEDDVLKPYFTWQGFRYIRFDEYPRNTADMIKITAVAVHSDIRRTGCFVCGNKKINQLYHNIIWGQKSNYIDVPTDCPQRDERLGWTGDAQVFVRTAAINFDVEKFFEKWLGDLALGQGVNGEVYGIAPMVRLNYKTHVSAAWGDAAVICPWEIYLAYGNKEILENQYESMKKWIDYMHSAGEQEYLWLDGKHYGDWLAMDGDDYMGSTSTDYIASAFFAHSTQLFVKVGKILGKDIKEYEILYKNIVSAFKKHFTINGVPTEKTQTAYALALHFDLCDEREKTTVGLVKMIEENGMRLSTGFVGTPYLLHALSENGRTDIAYELLFQEDFPSWLYSVDHGATTMWEHWDGVREDSSFWSKDMNSYNHYAYGVVYDWIFGVAAGVKVFDDGAGYTHISIKPETDKRMGFLEASIETRQGKLSTKWYYKDDVIYFEFEIPNSTKTEIELEDGQRYTVSGGRYIYNIKY